MKQIDAQALAERWDELKAGLYDAIYGKGLAQPYLDSTVRLLDELKHDHADLVAERDRLREELTGEVSGRTENEARERLGEPVTFLGAQREVERLEAERAGWGDTTAKLVERANEATALRAQVERLEQRISAATQNDPAWDAREFRDCFEKTTDEEILDAAFALGLERGTLRAALTASAAPDATGRELERMAEAVHDAYLATCQRLGWEVKPFNQVPYASLSEASKELDRASVRAVVSALAAPSEESDAPPGRASPQVRPPCRVCAATAEVREGDDDAAD